MAELFLDKKVFMTKARGGKISINYPSFQAFPKMYFTVSPLYTDTLASFPLGLPAAYAPMTTP